jgi:hypothetical protein
MTRKIASLQINAAEAANDQLLIARSNNLIFDSVANILVAGNAITIEANGRISSTAAGGGNVTISSTPPADKKAGDVWISDESGSQFTWVSDADSSQWVEFGTVGLQGATGTTGTTGATGAASTAQLYTYNLLFGGG